MSQVVHMNHTDDDAKSIVERAAAIVAELELDGDLKVPAFEQLVRLLAGENIVVESPQAGILGMPPLRTG